MAYYNWRRWQDIYEYGGIELLKNPQLFNIFCTEYSVGRTICAGKRDGFRQHLQQKMPRAVEDRTGKKLDNLNTNCRAKYGANGKSLRSAISKVAVFFKPDYFVAYDKYALEGLRILLGKGRKLEHSYKNYLDGMREVWSTRQDLIKQKVSAQGIKIDGPNGDDAFGLRVLDCLLMIEGSGNTMAGVPRLEMSA